MNSIGAGQIRNPANAVKVRFFDLPWVSGITIITPGRYAKDAPFQNVLTF
ncbi:MAG: hypothetical protein WC208_16395 [Gallionella sp.]|jgi:hypothetical protein